MPSPTQWHYSVDLHGEETRRPSLFFFPSKNAGTGKREKNKEIFLKVIDIFEDCNEIFFTHTHTTHIYTHSAYTQTYTKWCTSARDLLKLQEWQVHASPTHLTKGKDAQHRDVTHERTYTHCFPWYVTWWLRNVHVSRVTTWRSQSISTSCCRRCGSGRRSRRCAWSDFFLN